MIKTIVYIILYFQLPT